VFTRYHICTRPAPAPFTSPAKFRLVEGDDYVKYGRAAFDERRQGGDPLWTPQVITQTWYQAETGRIPISGAGYGGPFAGAGFDGIWLDMSEIVRPTRDGIHGREYISTAADLGRRPDRLEFDAEGRLTNSSFPLLQIPIPVLFDPIPVPTVDPSVRLAAVKAAEELGTFALVRKTDWTDELASCLGHIAPLLTHLDDLRGDRVERAALVEIEAESVGESLALWEAAKTANPQAMVSVRLPLTPASPQLAGSLVQAGVEIIHFVADEAGYEYESRQPRFLTSGLREVHEYLVDTCRRDSVSLIVSGGIAAAEHVPKALVCGADAVAVDLALVVALGCALWADERYPCPVEQGSIDPQWGRQRIVNLMAAWRDQLLEVLGAMGLREVRRLRGELGRAIFYEEEERTFRALFAVAGIPAEASQSPLGGEVEGDLRWTGELLRATAEQARTGKPPGPGEGYRLGRSGGGFDRLRFAFEAAEAEEDCDRESGNGDVNLSLELNLRHDGRPWIRIPHPWYGAGMSFGSVSLNTMLARAKAAQLWGSFTSTGEGGYPNELVPYADHIITQVATGLFGVSEETIQRARLVEFKYAQGAKPGVGGHLLGSKVSASVAAMREAVQGSSLFSPFPFHSVYSVEDHKKHVDWIQSINPRALISVKVSTPTDVDMVAVGSYYAGAQILHLDGAYGGTGAAPEVAKKSIAMPIEYAIPKVHRFLEAEGIRDEMVLVASGGVRTAYDIGKAIALGADGCVIGTAELVALGCTRQGTCEKDKGCPFGIATTDAELCKLVDPEEGARRISNLYASWRIQLADILRRLGLRTVRELRGRADLLTYVEA
jgi:glutamate synthase domain-containing protein 2